MSITIQYRPVPDRPESFSVWRPFNPPELVGVVHKIDGAWSARIVRPTEAQEASPRFTTMRGAVTWLFTVNGKFTEKNPVPVDLARERRQNNGKRIRVVAKSERSLSEAAD